MKTLDDFESVNKEESTQKKAPPSNDRKIIYCRVSYNDWKRIRDILEDERKTMHEFMLECLNEALDKRDMIRVS